jgi:hypothetical protein
MERGRGESTQGCSSDQFGKLDIGIQIGADRRLYLDAEARGKTRMGLPNHFRMASIVRRTPHRLQFISRTSERF